MPLPPYEVLVGDHLGAMTSFQVLRFSRSPPRGVGARIVSSTNPQGARSLRDSLAPGRVRAPLQFPKAPPGAQRRQLR